MLAQLDGTYRLVASLLYGSGLRLLEALGLRVKDLDFERCQIVVRQGKVRKDRVTPLAEACFEPLRGQLGWARELHRRDLALDFGSIPLPDALARKYPNATREWPWQFVFPASRRLRDAAAGAEWRPHLHASAVQRAVRAAVRAAWIPKPASCHTLRHSFATHLLERGCDIRTL